jgi:ribonucleoside-diphosphate reductase alpha chain
MNKFKFGDLVRLCSDLSHVDLSLLSSPTLDNLELLANDCQDKWFEHYEWSYLAARVLIEKYKRESIPPTFSQSSNVLRNALEQKYYKFVLDNASILDAMIVPERDMKFDFFAIKTLLGGYIQYIIEKNSDNDDVKTVVETPQYMYLRIATYLHYPDLHRIKQTYDDLSLHRYSHASPTMFNAGMKIPALSSCFLVDMQDTMVDISHRWEIEAIISKNAGGIGKNFSNIRHSKIGVSGMSKGIIPWLKIDNEIMKATDQSGKRKGSMCAYLKVWHTDIIEFIEASDKNGSDDMRAKDLYYAVTVNDLFMKRVENDEVWSLFCPNEAKGLNTKFGKDFERQYLAYESQRIYKAQYPARMIMHTLVNNVMINSIPYVINIDSINRKSNQTHNGDMVHMSNLCTEIAGVTNEREIFSCNLGSICLKSCVEKDSNGNTVYNWELLRRLTRDMVRNLNQTIDRTHYPDEIPEIRYSNMRRRPLGIGVQGLADTFALMELTWVDDNDKVPENTREFHERLFQEMYIAAVSESIDMAEEEKAYSTYRGSPASKGLLQPDLWEIERLGITEEEYRSKPELWFSYKFIEPKVINKIRRDLDTWGMRNSLLFALMPTASSAHILSNNESFEPFNAVMYARSVLTGQFAVVNRYFVDDCFKNGREWWSSNLLQHLMNNNGIIDTYDFVKECGATPEEDKYLKKKYRSIFDIPHENILQLSADRGKYVCQTQSLNCHMRKPSASKVTAAYFRAWKLGLKTYMYYLRYPAKSSALNHASRSLRIRATEKTQEEGGDGTCVSCTV